MVTASKFAHLIIFSFGVSLLLTAQSENSIAAPAQSVIVGVLEDVPGHVVGQHHVRAVRVAFKKESGQWLPFPSDCPNAACLKSIVSNYPSEVTWTIVFDGRDLGKIESHRPEEYKAYSDIGLEPIAEAEKAPIVGKRSAKFSGYLGQLVYRPLVVNSQPNFSDPENWKRTQLPSALIEAIRREFRRMYPNGSRCDEDDPTDDRLLSYRDKDLRVEMAYSSRDGWSVVQMQLTNYLCSGEPEHEFADQSFAVGRAGEIRFLGEGLRLVNAGDYDNDGKSEFVFSITRDNRGGYELFYDEFRKRAVFEYSYH